MVSNDHYIPRFLTKPWEFGQRQLFYYDFVLRGFDQDSSNRVFAREGINTEAVEDFLQRHVEGPASRFVDKLAHGQRADETDQTTRRAILLLFFLNTQRIREAYGETGPFSLENMVGKGEGFFDGVARWMSTEFKVRHITLPEPQELVFTSAGIFAVPFIGEPALALPLGLRDLLIARRGGFPEEELDEAVHGSLVMKFSFGLGSDVHRVVLTERWREDSQEDAEETGRRLLDIRQDLRSLFDLVGRMSEIACADRWRIDP
jgi:hypothetical protein